MKPHCWITAGIASSLLLAGTLTSLARPIDFREVSLLVRARENERSITNEVSNRKLLHKLTADEEAKLKSQGASESLLQSLRSPNVVISQSDAAAYEKASAPDSMRRGGSGDALDRQVGADDVRMLNVAFERPVNLSYWGGPDLEVVFHRQPRIDFGQTPDFHLINPVGTGIHTSTYLGFSAAGWSGGEAAYTSATAHSFARPMWMDRSNPVSFKGLPYMLYPVYAAGDVALYYVCDASADSVRLALIARR